MTISTIISPHQGEAEAVPRFLWRTMEPYHAMVYFAPEAREIYAAAGLKGFWMGYFGSRAAESCPIAGRALFAAHSALPWPDQPHMVLWHAATLLREFRGDGHVTSLLSAGVDGCEAHLTLAGTGAVGREALQPFRGWSDDAWESAKRRLLDRGWLDAEGRLTEAGSIGRRGIEQMTDQLAEAPWTELGQQDCTLLAELMWPISDTIVRQGGIPIPNPMGLGWP